ncbi:hypothetical protein Pan97_13320 [Bremerella volcania]|uniref:DUF1559 domain-containing protein n=2 Tax=Bremerella volcania TaxID=2527984 RepID=A0A518C532_9BACT|nr:hypothetical protein Pan97_13320 [Bremerella volcania]
MQVLERYAGQTGPCAVCAKTITIPGEQGSATEPGFSRVSSRRSSEDNGGVALGTLIGILGGSVAFFSVIFLTTVLIFRVAIPAANQMRTDSLNRASLDKIERIVQALNTYHDLHGSYPPAYFTDENGQPTHSWRVMILPQLNRNDLYQQYNFNEPWNSPTNINVTTRMPDVYRSETDNTAGSTSTNFAAVIGKRTMFPHEKSTTRSQAIDDPETILMVVEVHGLGFDWTDPTANYDLDSPQGTMIIDNNRSSMTANKSMLTGNLGVMSEDTYHADDNTSITLLQSMATRSGSEDVGYEMDLFERP